MPQYTVVGPITSSPRSATPPSYPTEGGPAALSHRIDRRKLRTKACQYVTRGVQCPFGSNCAFSHNIDPRPPAQALSESMQSDSAPTLTVSEPRSPITDLAATPRRKTEAYIASPPPGPSAEVETGSESSGAAFSLPHYYAAHAVVPPPPSYDEALTMTAEGTAAAPSCTTPTRYRHDPYSFQGIVLLP